MALEENLSRAGARRSFCSILFMLLGLLAGGPASAGPASPQCVDPVGGSTVKVDVLAAARLPAGGTISFELDGVRRVIHGSDSELARSTPLTVDLRVDEEYSLTWSGLGAEAVHARVRPQALAPGQILEVDTGGGWHRASRLDAFGGGSSLDLDSLTHRLRIRRAPTPVAAVEVAVREPCFATGPALHPQGFGVSWRDQDGDRIPDLVSPSVRWSVSLGGVRQDGRPVSAGSLDLEWDLLATGPLEPSKIRYRGLPGLPVTLNEAGGALVRVEAPEVVAEIFAPAPDSLEVRLTPTALASSPTPVASGGGGSGGSGGGGTTGTTPSSQIFVLERQVVDPGYPAGLLMQQWRDGVEVSRRAVAARGGASQIEIVVEDGEQRHTYDHRLQFIPQTQTDPGDATSLFENSWWRFREALTTDGPHTVRHDTSDHVLTQAGELQIFDRENVSGDDPQVASFHYALDWDASRPGEYGQMLWLREPHGHWESYEYRPFGQMRLRLRARGGGAQEPWTATTHDSRSDLFFYESDPRLTGLADSTFLSETGDQIYLHMTKDGTAFSSWTHYLRSMTADATGEPVERTVIRRARDASFQLVQEVRESYHPTASGHLAGRARLEAAAAGRQVSFDYELGSLDPVSGTFTPDASGDFLRRTQTEGTVSQPLGLTHKTLRHVTVEDVHGLSFVRETHVFDGQGHVPASVETWSYDGHQRLVEQRRDGRIVFEGFYQGLTETTFDENGIGREIERDLLGREIRLEKIDGPVTLITYDGNDRTETRDGQIISVQTLDLCRRLSASTDAIGRATQIHYDTPGRTIRHRLPGGLEVELGFDVEARPVRAVNLSGGRVIPRFLAYGRTNDGLAFAEQRSVAPDDPRFVRVVSNWLGQEVRLERPAVDGLSTVVTHRDYDFRGLPVRSRFDGNVQLADQLTEYDELGRLFRRGLDMDGDGVLRLDSDDQIVEHQTTYELVGGHWSRVEKMLTYPHPGDPTPEVVRTRVERLERGVNAPFRQETLDADGLHVITTVAIDRANRRRTTTEQRSGLIFAPTRVEENGLLLSENLVLGQGGTTYGYDLQERLVSRSDRGAVTSYEYAANGQRIAEVDARGRRTEYAYYPSDHANAGQLWFEKDGLARRTYSEYNDRGQRVRLWGGLSRPQEWTYDAYGATVDHRTFREFPPGGGGWPANPGPADVTTRRYHTSTGQPIEWISVSGGSVSYAWDDAGRVANRIWARGVSTSYAYDLANRVVERSYSDATPTTSLTYDRSGRLATVSGGVERRYAYTPGGQIEEEWVDDDPSLGSRRLIYLYDGSGRRISLAMAGTSVHHHQSYAYDWFGRVSQIREGDRKADFIHDWPAGNMSTRRFSWGSQAVLEETRNFEASGRLSSVEISAPVGGYTALARDFSYDAFSRMTSVEHEDQSFWELHYSSSDQISATSRHKPGSDGTPNGRLDGWRFGYLRDTQGELTLRLDGADRTGAGWQITGLTRGVGGQLEQVSEPGTFDVLGHADPSSQVWVDGVAPNRDGAYFWQRLPSSPVSGEAWLEVEVEIDGESRIEQRWLDRDRQPTYDADGNLLSDGEWEFTWDGENRLVRIDRSAAALAAGAPDVTVRYAYDHLGRRVARWQEPEGLAQRFLHDGDRVVAVLNVADGDAVPAQTFTWGPSGLAGTGSLLWITDRDDTSTGGQNGTYFAVGNGAGDLVSLWRAADLLSGAPAQPAAAYDYNPSGELLSASGPYASANPVRSGHRWQDPVTGFLESQGQETRPDWGDVVQANPLTQGLVRQFQTVPGSSGIGDPPSRNPLIDQLPSGSTIIEHPDGSTTGIFPDGGTIHFPDLEWDPNAWRIPPLDEPFHPHQFPIKPRQIPRLPNLPFFPVDPFPKKPKAPLTFPEGWPGPHIGIPTVPEDEVFVLLTREEALLLYGELKDTYLDCDEARVVLFTPGIKRDVEHGIVTKDGWNYRVVRKVVRTPYKVAMKCRVRDRETGKAISEIEVTNGVCRWRRDVISEEFLEPPLGKAIERR